MEKNGHPRALARKLATQLREMMENNEGRMLALRIMEEVPWTLRGQVAEYLSSVYEPEMSTFFWLLEREFGAELQEPVARARKRFASAGLPSGPPPSPDMSFVVALANRTRHQGVVPIDVVWLSEEGLLEIESYRLAFGHDGILQCEVFSEVPAREYFARNYDESSLVLLELDQAAYLIREAYACNVRCMSRPGLGRFLYEKYLHMPQADLTPDQRLEVMTMLTPQLSPREAVDSFLRALRNGDAEYAAALLSRRVHSHEAARDLTAWFLTGGTVVDAHSLSSAPEWEPRVEAYAVFLSGGDPDRLWYTRFQFTLEPWKGRWVIADVASTEMLSVGRGPEFSPLDRVVQVCPYEVVKPDELLRALEDSDWIEEEGASPAGVHMRVRRVLNPREEFQDIFSWNRAVLVLNSDDLVVISPDAWILNEIDGLVSDGGMAVRLSSTEVPMAEAYRYLSGRFACLAHALANGQLGAAFTDGMSCWSVTYGVLDRSRVQERVEALTSASFSHPGDVRVYYQYRQLPRGRRELVAEYLLAEGLVRLTALGAEELFVLQRRFEENLQDCLVFEGLEARSEAVFDLLTAEVRERHPQLEEAVTQGYLERWYRSRLHCLEGMTPAEARYNQEGKQLLWAMFKRMQRRDRSTPAGVRLPGPQLADYMRKVGM